LLDGFDPKNDENDRRILFEVTGMRLFNEEFRDDSTSSSNGDDGESSQGSESLRHSDTALLPIDYAFMYRGTIQDSEGDESDHDDDDKGFYLLQT